MHRIRCWCGVPPPCEGACTWERHTVLAAHDAALVMWQQDTKAARETSAMQSFYDMMSADPDRAFYGPGHIKAAHELGAIQVRCAAGLLDGSSWCWICVQALSGASRLSHGAGVQLRQQRGVPHVVCNACAYILGSSPGSPC